MLISPNATDVFPAVPTITEDDHQPSGSAALALLGTIACCLHM